MSTKELIGGYSAMQKFNAFELYIFGKEMSILSRHFKGFDNQTKLSEIRWPLSRARQMLKKHMSSEAILLPTSKRAVADVYAKVESIYSEKGILSPEDGDKIVDGVKLYYLKESIEKLEVVLGADMPGISSYVVAQKGIYKTEDLIEHAHKQVSESALAIFSAQAKRDIDDAGRCLAFELSTAAAFHLWRAVETVMISYLEALTGQAADEVVKNRNWGACIKALVAASANDKITQFLQHIKDQYRNPISHPEENVGLDEARRLFSVAVSSMEQMAAEVARLEVGKGSLPIFVAQDHPSGGLEDIPF